MSDKKIIVVFGATGAQGGSVVNSLLEDPATAKEFKVRGITRDPSKPNAKALEARGVECVAADLNSKESVTKALKGAYAVFAVTDYWSTMDENVEIQQGKNVADASKECGIQHLVWSTLFDINKLTNGKFSKVYHFDSKAAVDTYIRESGVPMTSYLPGFYMSNLTTFMRPTPPDNAYTLALPLPPTTKIPLFAAELDTGKFVKAILKNREKLLGKRVYAATADYTPNDYISAFKKAFPEVGKTAKFVELSKEDYKGALAQGGMPEKAQEELAQNMMFMNEFGYYGKETLDESLSYLEEKPTELEPYVADFKGFKDLK